jgi:hypothetical protein
MVPKEKLDLYLFDGTPNGAIQVAIGGWNGVAYKIPRTEIDKYKELSYLKQHGVYFLFGKSEDEENDAIYIGKAGERQNGEGILFRVKEHETDQYKDFWTEVIVLTTTDDRQGLSEISYLENRFYDLASEAKSFAMKNDKRPNPGKISDGDKSVLERFINYTKLIVNILGYKAFEKSGGTEFYIAHGGKKATGKRTIKGFMILADSYIKESVSDGLATGHKDLRKKFATRITKDWKLQEDILFSSPSAAAVFVLGRNANGYIEWKTADGKTLKEIDEVS